MSEGEIRRVLREICEELDRTSRRVRRVVLPAALGAGLALSSGCGGRGVPAAPDGSGPDRRAAGRADLGLVVDGPAVRGDTLAPPSVTLYSVPTPTLEARALKPDLGDPISEYAVPDPQPDYMAPLYMAPSPTPDAR
jgi:hypothetical protein